MCPEGKEGHDCAGIWLHATCDHPNHACCSSIPACVCITSIIIIITYRCRCSPAIHHSVHSYSNYVMAIAPCDYSGVKNIKLIVSWCSWLTQLPLPLPSWYECEASMCTRAVLHSISRRLPNMQAVQEMNWIRTSVMVSLGRLHFDFLCLSKCMGHIMFT